jgi:hypothetical protein
VIYPKPATAEVSAISVYLIQLPATIDNFCSLPTLYNCLSFFVPTMMNRSLLRAAARSIQAGPTSVAGRRYASSAVFNWEDPLAAAELFTDEELAIQDTARQYCQDKLAPRVLGMSNLLCFCCEMVN